MSVWFQSAITRFMGFFNSFPIILAVKILLSFMFELNQMEAIDSDEFKGNPFFLFKCQRTMHTPTEFK